MAATPTFVEPMAALTTAKLPETLRILCSVPMSSARMTKKVILTIVVSGAAGIALAFGARLSFALAR
jgi:hypothetical protein